MKKHVIVLGMVLALLAPLLVARSGAAQQQTETRALADAGLIIEINSTDGDAGIQVSADGDAWKRLKLFAPDGRKVLDIRGKTLLRDFGLTELFSESSEPPFTQLPFDEFKTIWPEGRYRFRATTIDGVRLVGSAVLSHDVPDGPMITSPTDGATVPRKGLFIAWRAVRTPGVEIEGYQVIVSNETDGYEFTVELPATARRVKVPAKVLTSGADAKVEVLAKATNGNQTITEHAFTVR